MEKPVWHVGEVLDSVVLDRAELPAAGPQGACVGRAESAPGIRRVCPVYGVRAGNTLSVPGAPRGASGVRGGPRSALGLDVSQTHSSHSSFCSALRTRPPTRHFHTMDSYADPSITSLHTELYVAWRPPDAEDERLLEAASERRVLLKRKNGGLEYKSVTLTLNSVCTNPFIRVKLEYRAKSLQHIRVLAAHVAIFDCTRVFEQHRRHHPDYPDVPASSQVLESILSIGRAFFYRCCKAVYVADGGRGQQQSRNRPLEESLRVYFAGMNTTSDLELPRLSYADADLHELSKEMLTAAQNHISTNFERRLVKYIRLRLAYPTPAAAAMVERLKNPDVELTSREQELLAWLEYPPTSPCTLPSSFASCTTYLHSSSPCTRRRRYPRAALTSR